MSTQNSSSPAQTGNSKQIRFEPKALDRLREFFIFCNLLEEHPFFKAHEKGGSMNLKLNFPESGKDTAALSFDEYHLESFLTRLRQFYFANELFYYKDLRRASNEAFGDDSEFQKFYDQLVGFIAKPYPKNPLVQVFRPNGRDLTEGFAPLELVEARLYTGAVHSERRLNAEPGSASEGLANAHIAISAHLTFVVAEVSLALVKNIFAFRNRLLLRARQTNKTNIFPEIQEFDTRSKQAGH